MAHTHSQMENIVMPLPIVKGSLGRAELKSTHENEWTERECKHFGILNILI